MNRNKFEKRQEEKKMHAPKQAESKANLETFWSRGSYQSCPGSRRQQLFVVGALSHPFLRAIFDYCGVDTLPTCTVITFASLPR